MGLGGLTRALLRMQYRFVRVPAWILDDGVLPVVFDDDAPGPAGLRSCADLLRPGGRPVARRPGGGRARAAAARRSAATRYSIARRQRRGTAGPTPSSPGTGTASNSDAATSSPTGSARKGRAHPGTDPAPPRPGWPIRFRRRYWRDEHRRWTAVADSAGHGAAVVTAGAARPVPVFCRADGGVVRGEPGIDPAWRGRARNLVAVSSHRSSITALAPAAPPMFAGARAWFGVREPGRGRCGHRR